MTEKMHGEREAEARGGTQPAGPLTSLGLDEYLPVSNSSLKSLAALVLSAFVHGSGRDGQMTEGKAFIPILAPRSHLSVATSQIFQSPKLVSSGEGRTFSCLLVHSFTLCFSLSVTAVTNTELKGGRIYLRSWFQKFQSMATWLHCFWASCEAEHQGRQSMVGQRYPGSRETQKGKGGDRI
jgi:hypothetical protein